MKKYIKPQIEFGEITDIILSSGPTVDGGVAKLFSEAVSPETAAPDIDGRVERFNDLWRND